jgi:hypothetical protein
MANRPIAMGLSPTNGHSSPPNGVNEMIRRAFQVTGLLNWRQKMPISFRGQVIVSALMLAIVIAFA